MIIKEINQFHHSSAYGDAITNSMIYIKRLLNGLGIKSKIFADNIAPEYSDEIEYYKNYISSKSNILLLHHSLGYDFEDWILSLNDNIILVYHNITPEIFLEKGSISYNLSIKGRKQLNFLKERVIATICDSEFNKNELIERGYDVKLTKVIPLLLDIDKVKTHTYNLSLIEKYKDTLNILFIGRLVKNKCQDEIIEVINLLKKKQNNIKCFLIGGASNDLYERTLYEKIVKYNLENNVIVTGKVSDEDIYSYYRLSNLFLCLSEHEGFGVPLIESMIFELPVFAYESSNIKNTLNNSGVTFKSKDYNKIVDEIIKVMYQKELKEEIISTQKKAMKIYEKDFLLSELKDFFDLLQLKYNLKITLSNTKVGGYTYHNNIFTINNRYQQSYIERINYIDNFLSLQKKSIFILDDFLKYDDEEFVEYSYIGILKREVDNNSRVILVNHIKQGKTNKMDVLLNLLNSDEYKLKNSIKIKDLEIK